VTARSRTGRHTRHGRPLARAVDGDADPYLTAAAYALANYVIGSATMQVAGLGQDEAEQRRAADRHVRAHGGLCPALAAHGVPIGHDWDSVFAQGLTYLLDGIEMQSAAFADR
jgi:hypothetical protein